MTSSFPMLATYIPNGSVRSKDELHSASTNSASRSNKEDGEVQQAATSPLTSDHARPQGNSRTHRKLVFTDPVAFRYLEEDESTTVLARGHRLEGYELYVVEQWVVSRAHPTFTICTYTGDTSHSIRVSVLAVPHDQSTWSKRMKLYFEAISQSYARERETHLGTLLVTNLSGFPSALNVITVPEGDIKKHREDFIVNENLRRMGCAGRAAMSLQYPQPSTINKFHHMYRTSEKIPLYSSVMEIVRFCQLALVLYGKLDSTYADGLLCDITEKAISEWWNEIGFDFHNVEPSDGIFGPTTVSALIGLMIGAYNRLKDTGAPVGKDPLDLSSMKRAIAHFQKATKMERSRRLDRATLDRLHRVTAKNAEDEGLGVTRALKSTVAGLGGKGGEMLARGFGGSKEKAGIAEVETLDIERLAQLVSGRSMKWLWQGKDKGFSNAASAVHADELHGRVFSTDGQGNFIWTSQVKDDEDGLDFMSTKDTNNKEIKLNRLREAVGSHSSKGANSKADHTDDEGAKHDFLAVSNAIKELRQVPASHRSSQSSMHEFPPYDLSLADASISESKPDVSTRAETDIIGGRERSHTNQSTRRHALRGLDHKDGESPSRKQVREDLENVREELKDRRYHDFSTTFTYQQPQAKALKRSLSALILRPMVEERSARLSRHLSFSLISDAVESKTDDVKYAESNDESEPTQPAALVKIRKEQLRQTRDLAAKFMFAGRGFVPFVENRIGKVEHITHEAQIQLEELNNLYYQHLEDYQTMQATSTDLVAREKTQLNEAMRSIEMLGQKLDYELDSLQSRMQEVEESVEDFEKRVLDIEANVKALVVEPEVRPSSWYERFIPFLGRRGSQQT